jgi:DNA topoisomerase-1
MADKLVIVESPSKARTIARYLGKGYEVKASGGHIRDLPPKKFGVDVENGFEPTYVILPGSRKTVNQLKRSSKNASVVYLAPDPDREGEAIAWHLTHALGIPDDKAQRATFHEITSNAVKEAFQHAHSIDMNLVNAQQARRVLDRIVGYELSPLISKKIVRGLSAGRVQSVALRLVVEREEEVDAFDSEEYWEIDARLKPEDEKEFVAKLKKLEGKDPSMASEEDAKKCVQSLSADRFVISEVEEKKTTSGPAPPFITSSLQRAASSKLRMSPSHTMRIAQQLYEGVEIQGENEGLITYMRTDSTRISKEALGAVREVIKRDYGEKYLPEKPNFFKSPASAQAAHEAIRPTDVNRKPEFVKKYLSRRQYELYSLIYRRFVASQMEKAVYLVKNVEIKASPDQEGAGATALFVAKGRQMLFDGYTRVMPRKKVEKDQLLPPMKKGLELELLELIPSQHFTQPPPRYTEASLVRELERKGIGRPSTYAPTISTLLRKHYVRRKQRERTLFPSDLGREVVRKLVKHFPKEMDYDFTRKMEEQLDRVEEGKVDWRQTLEGFYESFSKDLEKARSEMVSVSDEEHDGEIQKCPECGRRMVLRYSRQGDRFLGCSGFPECNYTASLDDDGEETEHRCPKCGGTLIKRTSRKGNEYLACSNYPDCKTVMGIDKDDNPVELRRRDSMGLNCPRCGDKVYLEHRDDGQVAVCGRCSWQQKPKSIHDALEETADIVDENTPPCEKCGSPMEVRQSKRGMFLGCSKYPDCDGTRNLGKDEMPDPVVTTEKCEKCGKPLVMRWGRFGRFLACSGFPRCRNTWRIPSSMKDCPVEGCDGKLMKKVGKDGKEYLGCTRFPDCDYTQEEGEEES